MLIHKKSYAIWRRIFSSRRCLRYFFIANFMWYHMKIIIIMSTSPFFGSTEFRGQDLLPPYYMGHILVTGATVNNKIEKIISNLSSKNPMQKLAVKRFFLSTKSHFCSLDWFSDMFQDYRRRTGNTASTWCQE